MIETIKKMRASVRNILIPVDLSINTEVAVKKGLELAHGRTTIHLLHVQIKILPGLTGGRQLKKKQRSWLLF